MGAAAATLSLGEAIGILHLGCRTCFLLAGSGEMENKMDAIFFARGYVGATIAIHSTISANSR